MLNRTFGALALVALVSGAAAQNYSPTVVTTAGDPGNGGRPQINNFGMVSGQAANFGFIWIPFSANGTSGTLTTLTYKGQGAGVEGLNARGDAVGTYLKVDRFGGLTGSPLLWPVGSGSGSVVDTTGNLVWGMAINDSGDVAMDYQNTSGFWGTAISRLVKGKRTLYKVSGSGGPHAINNNCQFLSNAGSGLALWSPNTTKTSWTATVIDGSSWGAGYYDLNDSGQVVGQTADGHPFLFTGSNPLHDLLTDIQSHLPPTVGNWVSGYASGISNNGNICGRVSNGQGETTAYVLNLSTGLYRSIPVLAPYDFVGPQDVNDFGQVVAIARRAPDGALFTVLLNP